MKKLLSILTVIAFSATASYAGCGKTVTDEGTLKSVDNDKKEITIQTADGKTVARVLTPSTKAADKAGAEAKIDALVGKPVKVVSEHNKISTVTGA